jgi:tyrosine-protein phosphatase YwqE
VLNFLKKEQTTFPPILSDVHSHLLPAIDDGVKDLQEAERIIRFFDSLGFKKIITTPHIMSDHYPNTREIIIGKLAELQMWLKEHEIDIQVEAAAEYYLDEVFYKKVQSAESLLTWGGRYVLFETNFMTEPFQLKDCIFMISSSGYKPVLAHPERYHYMTMKKAEDLKQRGVLFQLNALSFIGYYSKQVQQLAYQLVDNGWIDFIGTDCHNELQSQLLPQAFKNRYFKKALELPLLNNSL